MFRSLKPAARVLVGANVVAVTATTLALVPATPAGAASSGFVTAASPAVVANTDTKQIAFTTTEQFNDSVPPQVVVTGPGAAGSLTGSAVHVAGNTVTATINFAPSGVPNGPGDYSVVICQVVGAGCSNALNDVSDPSHPAILQVTGTAPSVSGLSAPTRATNADTTSAFTIQGFNFAKGDTVAFVPTHAGDTAPTLTSLTYGAAQISGTLTGLSGATPGTYHAVVTDTLGHASPAGPADLLTVVVPPAISLIDPAATVGIGAGQNGHPVRTVTLKATAFDASHPAALSLPSGATDGLTVTVKSVAADTSPALTDIVATISTSTATVAQGVNLTLTDLTTGGRADQGFTVTPAPTITAVAPTSVGQNSSKSVEFTGANLDATPTLSFPAATGVAIGGTPTVAGGKITALLVTSPSAPTGKVPFSIVNSDGGVTDYTGGSSGTSLLSITAAPVLASVSPASVAQGVSGQTLTLNGSGFQSGMTATTPTGSGVTFGTVNVPSGSTTQATVPVDVTNTAPTGPVQVTLTNSDGGSSTSSNSARGSAFGGQEPP